MGQKLIGLVALVVALAGVGLGIYSLQQKQDKVGYVRFEELFMKYEGKMEASKEYEKKTAGLKGNLDTLQAELQAAVSEFRLNQASMDEKKQEETYNNLVRQEEQLKQYAAVVEDKIYAEDQQLSEGVVKQINSFVQEYGKNNGYSVILGTKPATGTVMYGSDVADITEEVLNFLNEKYRGEK